MTPAEGSGRDAETELIPAQSDSSPQTLELPVVDVEDEVGPVRAERPPTASAGRPAHSPEPAGAQPPPVAAPVPASAAPEVGVPAFRPVTTPPPVPMPGSGGTSHRSLKPIIAGVALVAVIAVTGITWAVLSRGGVPAASPGDSQAATRKLETTISSFDPSGGSGFRQRGDSWRTQTYKTARFGGLKPGVGLLLDVGEPLEVASVDFTVANGPITVELLAGDGKASAASGYAPTGDTEKATGTTSLRAAGKHRYWLLWVTEVGPQNGGYGAEISKVGVRAR